MSVLVVLKIPVSAENLERVGREQADHLAAITESSKEHGAIHHAFYEDGDGIVVVDEWDSSESFQAFFESQGENIGQLMAAAGAQGAPEPPSFHRRLEVGGEF